MALNFQAYKVLLVKKLLLSKTELKWLRGEINVSRIFEYQIRSRIKKKVRTLVDVELPLLTQTQFIKCDNNTGLGWDLETGTAETIAYLNGNHTMLLISTSDSGLQEVILKNCQNTSTAL